MHFDLRLQESSKIDYFTKTTLKYFEFELYTFLSFGKYKNIFIKSYKKFIKIFVL